MKITLKQLGDKLRCFVNPLMRRTRFGVSLRRLHDNDIAVDLVPRKPGCKASLKFSGGARVVDAFLEGLMVGLSLDRVGEEEQDGSDAY